LRQESLSEAALLPLLLTWLWPPLQVDVAGVS